MMMKIPRLPAGVAGLDFNQGRLTQTGSLLWVSSSPVVKSLVRDFPQKWFSFFEKTIFWRSERMRTAKKLAKTNLSFNLFLGPPPLPPPSIPPQKDTRGKIFLILSLASSGHIRKLGRRQGKGGGGYQGFSSLPPIPYLILGCITLVVVVVGHFSVKLLTPLKKPSTPKKTKKIIFWHCWATVWNSELPFS